MSIGESLITNSCQLELAGLPNYDKSHWELTRVYASWTGNILYSELLYITIVLVWPEHDQKIFMQTLICQLLPTFMHIGMVM
jgi:hypothetical protein